MEYFKPPEFTESSADESYDPGEMQDFSGSEGGSREPESFVADILEDKKKPGKRRVDYSDFNSAEFNEVDTLLTNVEEYSKRIREDVDKYARHVRNETDLFRSEIELELANALIKRIEAEKKAEEIIQDAEDRRDSIVKEAQEEGFQAGFAEGIQKHKEENEQLTQSVLSLIEEMKNMRTDMARRYEEQIVNLSLLIAEKVVYKRATSDKELVLDMLKKSIQHFEGQDNIKIRVHPVELDFILENQSEIKKYLDESQTVSIKADESVEPASPVIEADYSVVDISLEKQFKEIEQQLKTCIEDRRSLFV